jgi:hypothetical protein
VIGDKQVRLVPDEGGVYWKGATPDDAENVAEIMLAGVTGCVAGSYDKPREVDLGAFCHQATVHHNLEVVIGYE